MILYEYAAPMPVNFLNSASLPELMSVSLPAVVLAFAVAGGLVCGAFVMGDFAAGAFEFCTGAALSETSATWGWIPPILLIAKIAAPTTTRNDLFALI